MPSDEENWLQTQLMKVEAPIKTLMTTGSTLATVKPVLLYTQVIRFFYCNFKMLMILVDNMSITKRIYMLSYRGR